MAHKRARMGWLAAAGLLGLTSPVPASAATTVGQLFTPSTLNCGGPFTQIQTSVASGNSYTVSSPGVITSWSFQTNAMTVVDLKLKVGRSPDGTNYTIVGESAAGTQIPSAVNTYLARISVQPGDQIGIFENGGGCGSELSTDDKLVLNNSDVPLNVAAPFVGDQNARFPVAAFVEQDADQDGFGDETQDPCPTDPSKQTDCTAPETTITKGAPNKLDKSKVKFKFESDDPTAVFECKLKGKGLKRAIKQFSDCDSPRKYKRLDDGKFKFKVRATDEAGNVGAPAKDKFKVID